MVATLLQRSSLRLDTDYGQHIPPLTNRWAPIGQLGDTGQIEVKSHSSPSVVERKQPQTFPRTGFEGQMETMRGLFVPETWCEGGFGNDEGPFCARNGPQEHFGNDKALFCAREGQHPTHPVPHFGTLLTFYFILQNFDYLCGNNTRR